ncbi:MAG TPA: zinc-ribbon domain-containing protein, partial [Myxococcales bacterium]|nr:zinc-ribbon domain-containing protein [Myxococcales bacterium]
LSMNSSSRYTSINSSNSWTVSMASASCRNSFINSINSPEDDPAVAQLKSALAKKAEMNIIGYTYQQERSFDSMEAAASNEGSASSGMMGAGIGLGMGLGVGGAMGSAMGNMAQQIQTNPTRACPSCNAQMDESAKFCNGCGGAMDGGGAAKKVEPAGIKCDKCGAGIARGAKFCPECGDPVCPCPNCGADNDENATVCAGCGEALPLPCSKCGHAVASGTKFCPECGNSMLASCSGCNATLAPGAKFCPECGAKHGE